MGTEAVSTESFLHKFVEEFPEPLSPEDPLPLTPMSGRIGVSEVRGESLDWAQRLLAARSVDGCACISVLQLLTYKRLDVPVQVPGGECSCTYRVKSIM